MPSQTKVLSCDLKYIVDVVVRPKFGNRSISMRKIMITLILSRFDMKR